jgi:hypothetical protein
MLFGFQQFDKSFHSGETGTRLIAMASDHPRFHDQGGYSRLSSDCIDDGVRCGGTEITPEVVSVNEPLRSRSADMVHDPLGVYLEWLGEGL